MIEIRETKFFGVELSADDLRDQITREREENIDADKTKAKIFMEKVKSDHEGDRETAEPLDVISKMVRNGHFALGNQRA